MANTSSSTLAVDLIAKTRDNTDMTNQYGLSFNEYNEFCTRKLAHYNRWLTDSKRPFGVPYDGFPEEIELLKRAGKRAKRIAADVIVEAKASAKAKVAKPAKAKRAPRKGEGPTKQELACKIYARLAGDKAQTIAAIQADLGMSLAGATTYFYNARKLA